MRVTFDKVALYFHLSSEDAGTTSGLDLLSGRLGEKLGLDDDGDVGKRSSSEDLEETVLGNINDGSLLLSLEVLNVESRESPETVEVDDGAVVLGILVMEVAHTDLSEVTRMVLIEQDTVVVLASGVTTTSGMLTVLSNATVTGRDVSSVLTGLLQLGGHSLGCIVEQGTLRLASHAQNRNNRNSISFLLSSPPNASDSLILPLEPQPLP